MQKKDSDFKKRIVRLVDLKKHVNALGYENNEGGFVVLKNSIGTLNAVESTKDENQYKNRMLQLFKSGVIKKLNEENFIFTRDYCFPVGISRATLVLIGTLIGIDDANKKWGIKKKQGISKKNLNNLLVLQDQKKGVFAWGYEDENHKFHVLKESVGRHLPSNKKSNAYSTTQSLSLNNVIEDFVNNTYIFLKNHQFVSLTNATTTLLGTNTETKKSLPKWQFIRNYVPNIDRGENVLILENRDKGVHAWGKWNANGTFKVLKNSVGTLELTKSAKELGKHDRIRKELETKEVIISNPNISKYIFNKDYTFKSIRDTIIFLEGVYGMVEEKSARKWKSFPYMNENDSHKNKTNTSFILQDSKKGVFAWGCKYKNNEFIIKKHSKGVFSNARTTKNEKLYTNRISTLLKEGIIQKNNELSFSFVKDFIETSGIAMATMILLGYRIGIEQATKKWRNQQGVTYFDAYSNKANNENVDNKDNSEDFILNRFNKKINNN